MVRSGGPRFPLPGSVSFVTHCLPPFPPPDRGAAHLDTARLLLESGGFTGVGAAFAFGPFGRAFGATRFGRGILT